MASRQLEPDAHINGDASNGGDLFDSGRSRDRVNDNEQNLGNGNLSPSKIRHRGVMRINGRTYTEAKGPLSATRRGEGTGENHPDTDQGEAHDEDEDADSDASTSGAGIPRVGNTATRREKTTAKTEKRELEGIIQVDIPRKSSRRCEASTALGEFDEAAASRPTRKGVRFEQKRGALNNSPRRSSRAAAASATHQITEQLQRPKAAIKPPVTPVRGRKKATASPGSGRNRRSPGRPKTAEYEVELILNTRKKSGTTEYLVKWQGYHVKESTWEPAANLTHCPQALKQFRSRK